MKIMFWKSWVYFRVFLIFLFFGKAKFVGNNTNVCLGKGEQCGAEGNDNDYSIVSEIKQNHNLFLEKIHSAANVYEECNSTTCDCYMDTLVNDLKPFKNGITKALIDSVRDKGTRYIIHGNRLFRDKDCLFPARCSGIEHFLLQLLPNTADVELIINTRDWPQINKYFPLKGPVLSFSKTSDYFDIMYPAWAFWEGGPAISTYPRGLGRWDLHRKKLLEEGKKWSWDKKKPVGFFRGSRTSEKRDNLVLLSRKKPDLVDAQYTKNQAWKSSRDTLGEEPADVVTLEYHCQYKYLFNFRGVAASFRFKHLFLCGSLVIHVGNEWIEFFYPALKPWVHYIPLSDNFTEDEIIKLMTFLKIHDEIAKEIADRGQKFINDHLRMKEVKCYWRRLLKNYSKLLKYKVDLDKSLVEIT